MFGKYGLVLKNASYLTLFEVMRMAMPFIALPYLFRVVGEERYGMVVFAACCVRLGPRGSHVPSRRASSPSSCPPLRSWTA